MGRQPYVWRTKSLARVAPRFCTLAEYVRPPRPLCVSGHWPQNSQRSGHRTATTAHRSSNPAARNRRSRNRARPSTKSAATECAKSALAPARPSTPEVLPPAKVLEREVGAFRQARKPVPGSQISLPGFRTRRLARAAMCGALALFVQMWLPSPSNRPMKATAMLSRAL